MKDYKLVTTLLQKRKLETIINVLIHTHEHIIISTSPIKTSVG